MKNKFFIFGFLMACILASCGGKVWEGYGETEKTVCLEDLNFEAAVFSDYSR